MTPKPYSKARIKQRSIAAQRILDDKVFQEVVAELNEYVNRRWRRTAATEISDREGYWCLARGLDLVLKQLQNVAAKGTVSDDDSDADTGEG